VVGVGVSPDAWLVAGAPGSGKSTLARPLAVRLGAALIDRDSATAPLTRIVAGLVGAEPDDLDDPRMRDVLGDAAYEAAFATARETLAVGTTVVVVAPFTRALADACTTRRVQQQLGGPDLRVVMVQCPEDERRRRLARRAAPRDTRKLAASHPSTATLPGVPHVLVDGRLHLDAQVDLALRAPRVAGPAACPD
jgi:predicted kinase